MKNLKRIALLMIFSSWVAWMAAQPRMSVEPEVVNLGEVLFQLPKQIKFVVSNTGTEPLHIVDVHPSCGCTEAEWTHEPIAPGGKGEIRAVYDAAMLGVFQKELEVYTNASDEPVYLIFQGRVTAQATDYSGTFPIDLGQVRMNTNVVEFDEVNRGDMPVAELQIVNVQRKSYKPALMHLPPYLKATYVPEVLAGGRIGKIALTLDSKKLREMGLNQTSIYLARHMGDKVGEDNEISVSAVLLPDFSKLTAEELAVAPSLQLSTDSLDLGRMDKKKKLKGEVLLTNTGKSPLTVRSVQVFSKALDVRLGDRSLEPGKSTKLKITVLAKYLKSSKNRPRVLLITDDPKRPKEIITIKVKP